MSYKRNVYLQMKALDEARSIVLKNLGDECKVGVERIKTVQALGRVLAKPVTARLSSPNFHAAAMDGIAVKADVTFGAHETKPKILKSGKEAFPVNTGHVMPEGTNAVIMIEHIRDLKNGTFEIQAPVFPWQHVRKMGEDIVATELLFARRHVITAYCLGALLSAGVFEVAVYRKPKVKIIPTGGELADWRSLEADKNLKPGQVLESNGYVLGNLIAALGGVYDHHQSLGDDVETIKSVLKQALCADFDIVLILGGSSAGSEDFARAVISGMGEVLVHGVAMMPGKPAIVGRVQSKPVFGIPGYPVSAIMAFEQLVQPLLAAMQHKPEPCREKVQVLPTRKMPSKLGMEEFVRVKIGQVGERLVATPLQRAAGSITSLTEADGIIRIPSNVEGLLENLPVSAELLRPRWAIGKTLLAVGSHDNTLDVLADELRSGYDSLSLSSSHVGSMGGLMAVKRQVCHLAGIHLLDETCGSYNVSYIRKYLNQTPVRLVHLVMRDQGLMAPPGNPKAIRALPDLARKSVRFINRQGGSGTRILLDFRLKQLKISPDDIAGYDTEEFTHMAVAAAVFSGAADVGLGIRAAANALGLDFVPVITEQYDLVIPVAHFETEAVQILMNVISSRPFKDRVAKLGGYHTERTGQILL
ncbi:MAG: molybdopterin biosynthesis protein [Desulfobacteraceae bacterium]|nr:molybdopterin biosynthesis protein [Desulfobacteraceae bacterium]